MSPSTGLLANIALASLMFLENNIICQVECQFPPFGNFFQPQPTHSSFGSNPAGFGNGFNFPSPFRLPSVFPSLTGTGWPTNSGRPSYSQPSYSQPTYQVPRPGSPALICRQRGSCGKADHGTTLAVSWRLVTTSSTTPLPPLRTTATSQVTTPTPALSRPSVEAVSSTTTTVTTSSTNTTTSATIVNSTGMTTANMTTPTTIESRDATHTMSNSTANSSSSPSTTTITTASITMSPTTTPKPASATISTPAAI